MSAPRRSSVPVGGGSLESVFPGAGHVAARMRVLDWSQTTLGPPLSWPSTLRAAVALCLASPVPMAIWWGGELATFYNDAFVALLGADAYPAVFGLRAKAVWPQLWTEVGPEVERVRATGQAGWQEEARVNLSRATGEEPAHVTLALSPLLSERGEVEGVLCVGRGLPTGVAPEASPADPPSERARTPRGQDAAGSRGDSRVAPSVRRAASANNRVLVVDDNADFVRASAQLLSLRGYEVAVSHDGPSALATALRFRPHVCLLDVGLPRMDGYELARRLRELAGMTSDLRLVAITGYGQETDRLRSEEAGFDAHLVKPISWEVLAKAMSFR